MILPPRHGPAVTRVGRRAVLAGAGLLALRPAGAAPRLVLHPGQVLRGRFVQERHLQGFDAPLRSSGSFTLAPGQGLIWRAETPFAVTTIITAAGLVQDVSGSETMRLSAARLPYMSQLYAMLNGALAGDLHGLEASFTLNTTSDATGWRYDLTPKHPDDPMMPFQEIVVRGTALVDRVEMRRRGGDSDTLTFQDQTVSDGPLTADEAAALAR